MSVRRLIYFLSPADGFIIARLSDTRGRDSATNVRTSASFPMTSMTLFSSSGDWRERGTPTVINLARSLEF